MNGQLRAILHRRSRRAGAAIPAFTRRDIHVPRYRARRSRSSECAGREDHLSLQILSHRSQPACAERHPLFQLRRRTLADMAAADVSSLVEEYYNSIRNGAMRIARSSCWTRSRWFRLERFAVDCSIRNRSSFSFPVLARMLSRKWPPACAEGHGGTRLSVQFPRVLSHHGHEVERPDA